MTLTEAAKVSDRVRLKKVELEGWFYINFRKLAENEYISINKSELLSTDWEPVIEKKKKTVVMYHALFLDDKGRYYVQDYLFKDTNHVMGQSGSMKEFIKLLTDRPIEVEIEE